MIAAVTPARIQDVGDVPMLPFPQDRKSVV